MIRLVYFVQCGEGGPIKIGSTRHDPWSRMRQLQVGSAEQLRLLGCIQAKETRVHHRFRAYRISGEWFQPSQDILDFVRLHTTIPKEGSPTHKEIKEKNEVQVTCRVTRDVHLKILERQQKFERTTGIRPGISAVVRAMLDEVAGS